MRFVENKRIWDFFWKNGKHRANIDPHSYCKCCAAQRTKANIHVIFSSRYSPAIDKSNDLENTAMEKYESQTQKYPEFISLDQLHRICGIAKRSAIYLIQNSIIPAIDTGKQTWRYKIALVDVIDYLRKRDQVGSMIPPGAITSRRGSGCIKKVSARKSYAAMVSPGQEPVVAEYFNYIYADCDDLLTIVQIAEMTGLDKSTVMKLTKAGHIKSIASRPKYLIPKQYLMDFVVTRRFLESKSESELFIKILGGFEIWKTAKS